MVYRSREATAGCFFRLTLEEQPVDQIAARIGGGSLRCVVGVPALPGTPEEEEPMAMAKQSGRQVRYWGWRLRGSFGVLFLLALALAMLTFGAAPIAADAPCPEGTIDGGELVLPCSMPLADYEEVLYTWANKRTYTQLEGWAKDRNVRDTGPFILGANYGIHPAVRVYYSPAVYRWLENDRQGDLPIGATIVKEMFNPPAAAYEEQRPKDCDDGCEAYEAFLQENLYSWTIMIKDGTTKDGWFWSGPTLVNPHGMTSTEWEQAIAGTVDTNDFPFNFRDSDHGQASCLRCHAVSEGESTFADLENITGSGIEFRVDNSWRTDLALEQRPGGGLTEDQLFSNALHGRQPSNPDEKNIVSDPLPAPNPEFVRYFKLGGKRGVRPVRGSQVRSFPGQWADHVPAGPDGAEQFITSDNCIGCHGGLGGAPYGVNMFLQTGPDYGDGYNISPFGEWRWSPMGLAGRDPAFFAQLASELAILDNDYKRYPKRFDRSRKVLAQAKNAVVNTCLSCHGGMGQRQLLIDSVDDPDLEPDFLREYVYAYTPLTEEERTPLNDAFHKYGNLAREGISCTLCHHIAEPEPVPGKDWSPLETFLMTSTTGQFPYTPPDELSGPFEDVLEIPMQNALGITPKADAYVQDSKMCGTCHTINLPNVDSTDFKFPVLDDSAKLQAARLKEDYGADYGEFLAQFPHSIEQATFLEWQNSAFATDEASFQSCQDCHMPRDFHSLDDGIAIDTLTSQIASIQDASYPEVANDIPREERDVPFRDNYRRHELVGLNAFLLEMFDQFDPILGIAETDYMTSASTGNRLAIENMMRQARDETITLDVDIVSTEDGQLTADVTLTNLVGHRFPSGVAFRRAWIEFLVLDEEQAGEVFWASGRTNSVGLIVEGVGDVPLPTEFFTDNRWQPHYHGIPGSDGKPSEAPPITQQDQVQIYEEVTLNAEDDVTFSFIHRDEHVKDNRLLPKGWKASDEFPTEILRQFMEATDPVAVGGDPDYDSVPDFAGRDAVRYIVDLGDRDPEKVSVQVSVYYQAFQPFWLERRFQLSGDYPDTQRLYYIASHLNTKNTAIEDWKLPLVSASASVADAKATDESSAVGSR